jgi:phospholipase/carboxylesterase
LRLLLIIGVVLLAGPGCSRRPAPPSETPLAGEPGSTTRGEIAGVRYLEHMTGGARPDERVPMIVALHPMGGDPAYFLQLLGRYRRRARLILPYGHPYGGTYIWYDSVRDARRFGPASCKG